MQDSSLDHGSYFNTEPNLLGATGYPPNPTNSFVGLNSPFKFRAAVEQDAATMPNADSFGITQAMMRSHSAAGPAPVASNPMAQTYSQQAQKSSLSNRPSHLMIRGSSSPASAMPFASSTGRLPSRLSPAVATFQTQVQDPAMLGPSVGQAPSEYIANHPWYSMPLTGHDLPISPACPSLINYDTEDEMSSPMTRQTSAATDMPFGVQMSRDTSIAHNFYGQLPLRPQPKHLDLQPSLSLNFNASVPVPSPLSAEFRLETQDQYQLMPMTPATMNSVTMERSQSNTSHDSASSHRSKQSPSTRNKEALVRAIETGRSLALAPKPTISSIPSVTSIPPKRKLIIPAETSVKKKSRPSKRPKKEKIMCDVKGCGKMFSGSHELQRHRNNTHQTSKRFVIREPVADPADKSKTPICYPKKSIADCEKCKRMTTYACDYNAASHLRRKHFKPKDTSNGREDQDRGGKSGGAWPSMPELKKWIEVRYYDDAVEDAQSDGDVKTIDDLAGIGAGASADTDFSVSPAYMASGGISVDASDESFDMSSFLFDNASGLQADQFSADVDASSAPFGAFHFSSGTTAPLALSEAPVTPQQAVFNLDFSSIHQAYN